MRPEKQTLPPGESEYEAVYNDLLEIVELGELAFAGDPIWETQRSRMWYETCNIVVYPTEEEFDPDELNTLLFHLTSVQHTTADRASRPTVDTNLTIPVLYFDELLGEMEEETTFTYHQYLETIAAPPLEKEGEKKKIRPIRRRTWVHLYPNQESAEAAHLVMSGAEPEDWRYSIYHLTPEQIDSMRRKPKMFRLFKGY